MKEDMLIRLLEAFIWKNHGALFSYINVPGGKCTGADSSVQGPSEMVYHSHMFKVRYSTVHLISDIERWNPSDGSRDECPLGSLSIYDAFPTRSFRLFFKLYREHMSAICPTDIDRRT